MKDSDHVWLNLITADVYAVAVSRTIEVKYEALADIAADDSSYRAVAHIRWMHVIVMAALFALSIDKGRQVQFVGVAAVDFSSWTAMLVAAMRQPRLTAATTVMLKCLTSPENRMFEFPQENELFHCLTD